MLDDISLFAVIVNAGSLKEASRIIGVPPATVSRRLKSLEQSLGCRLVHRSSHQFTLTNEGQELYQQSSHLVDSLNSILDNFSSDVSGVKGKIKVLTPLSIVASTFQPIFSNFIESHPRIELELEMRNEVTRFLSSGADFAIRIGPQEDSELSQVKLGETRSLLVASPEYAETVGTLNSLADLSRCHQIVSNPLSRWTLEEFDPTGRSIGVEPFLPNRPRVSTNELRVSKQFALDGLGVALMPATEMMDDLRQGRLVNVMPNWQGVKRDVFAVWYRRQLLTHRASMLIDYLKEECQALLELNSDVQRLSRLG
ncbi:LysR family transcriptional regulator [Litoribrevibacter albus]|uniref:LysR family transcriptional regulator n=1 Tax=Litoribrevibacter albus TaxID=1473156 RepID=A0AA37W547_9GAMM|nr:LysR family transcriptional regulator [Litoribrevibacter albus]GLQ30792.1 LysR family transcriptional regulator [Litoribrevibacter albus]